LEPILLGHKLYSQNSFQDPLCEEPVILVPSNDLFDILIVLAHLSYLEPKHVSVLSTDVISSDGMLVDKQTSNSMPQNYDKERVRQRR
jgi:hypothetical protein